MQGDGLSFIAQPVGDAAYGIVDALVRGDPRVEEPRQVALGGIGEALLHVLRIRMAGTPLIDVVAHAGQERRVPQHVLEVVEHGGRLGVDMAIAALVAPFPVTELIAVGVDGRQAVAHGIALEGVVHLAVARSFWAQVASFIGGARRIAHEGVTIDALQPPCREELGEALVQEGPVGLVVAEHAVEPVVPHFVHEQTTVVRIAPAVQGEHGVLHAIARIGNDHLGVGVGAEVGAEHFDDARGVGGSVLPSARVRLLHQGHALHPVPGGFADAIRGVGGEGEVMHVLGMEAPYLPSVRIRGQDHRWRLVPWLVGEVADVELAAQFRGQYFIDVLQPARGVQHIVMREVQVHIEGAEVAVQLIAQVLLRVPTHAAVVHGDARIPVYAVVVLAAPGVEELHAPLHVHGPVRGEADAKGGAFTWGQRCVEPHLHNGVVLFGA